MPSVSLTSLWLPMLLSAVVIFVASSIVHMVLTYHRTDFSKLPGEADIAHALQRFDLPAGDFIMPHCSNPKEMQTPEFKERWKKGPRLVITSLPGGSMAMGGQLAQWFVFCLVVSVFAGYMASRALPAGAEYLRVSQIASTTAFLGYSMSNWAGVIWYKRSAMTALKGSLDGLIYGLLTGGVFGWLWPKVL